MVHCARTATQQQRLVGQRISSTLVLQPLLLHGLRRWYLYPAESSTIPSLSISTPYFKPERVRSNAKLREESAATSVYSLPMEPMRLSGKVEILHQRTLDQKRDEVGQSLEKAMAVLFVQWVAYFNKDSCSHKNALTSIGSCC
eukprot:5781359-Amphidinium_carterae.1